MGSRCTHCRKHSVKSVLWRKDSDSDLDLRKTKFLKKRKKKKEPYLYIKKTDMNFVLLSRVPESFLLKVKRTFHHEINRCITSFNIVTRKQFWHEFILLENIMSNIIYLFQLYNFIVIDFSFVHFVNCLLN